MLDLAERTHVISKLVEKVLQEEMLADTALTLWPNIDSESNPLIKELWHRLEHFADDAHIHDTDPEYKKAETKHMRSLLDELRAKVE